MWNHFCWNNHLQLCTSPDVLVRDDKGLTQWLCRVEPHSRVLLHGRRQLTSDGGGAGVQSTRNGRQESFISAAWADA